MGIRMVPIGTLFGRFRRLVHDLSRDLGKQIEFVTAGEETELDKTMIERLADPLVHLIRNSVDHGLEDADERARRPASRATGHGAAVGASIPAPKSRSRSPTTAPGSTRARIRAKAEEAGLLAPDAKIADQELYQHDLRAGLLDRQAR